MSPQGPQSVLASSLARGMPDDQHSTAARQGK